MSEIDRLQSKLKRLKSLPHSVQIEDASIELELQIDSLVAARTSRVTERALVLYRAFKHTGEMTVLLTDGRQVSDRLYMTGEPVQDMWNARSKALAMASMSFEQATPDAGKGAM